MEIYVGTSGYSFKEWKGSFYPKKLSRSGWLAHYSSHLSSVEINSSFYRMPSAATLESWAEQVPAHFRFALKASRRNPACAMSINPSAIFFSSPLVSSSGWGHYSFSYRQILPRIGAA
jgi:hypothetical protein